MARGAIPPPTARRDPVVIGRWWGHTVTNEYEWMRDPTDPDVLAHVAAEDAYADAALAHLDDLRRELLDEFAARRSTVVPSASPVLRRGGYGFETVWDGRDYPTIVRRASGTGAGLTPAVAVLDLDEVARGHVAFRLDTLEPSPDGQLLAYSADLVGDERCQLFVKDLASGSTTHVGVSRDQVVWSRDGSSLFYLEETEHPRRCSRLHRFDIGTGTDRVVYEERDRSLAIRVRPSADGTRIFLDVMQEWSHAPWSAIEVHELQAADASSTWRPVVPRGWGREVHVDHGSREYVLRIDDAGPMGRLVRTRSLAGPSADWLELQPMRPDVALGDLLLFRRSIVVTEWQDARCHVRVIDRRTRESTRIELPAHPVTVWPDADRSRYHEDVLAYLVTSPIDPDRSVDHHLVGGRAAITGRESFAGFEAERYELMRLQAPAHDGTPIPVTIARLRGEPQPAPVLLAGYGCYGHPVNPGFDPHLLSLLDRGVSHAVAHVRGGGELGRPWHDAGRRSRKRTSFEDFVAVAEHLVASGVALPGRIVAMGKSAGGTLVTGAMNLRPDLFAGVVALVPFADPLHVQLDETMPFTILERGEWGDPAGSQEEFETLAGYCPFTNLVARDYPAAFITGSLHDRSVPFWQAAKYAARLRHLGTGGEPVILRVDRHAGHAGRRRPADVAAARAEMLAFVLDRLGVSARAAPEARTRTGGSPGA